VGDALVCYRSNTDQVSGHERRAGEGENCIEPNAGADVYEREKDGVETGKDDGVGGNLEGGVDLLVRVRMR
jgi:hypothetical protein